MAEIVANAAPAHHPADDMLDPVKPGVEDSDAQALADMGYEPVFQRHFSQWTLFSFALSVSGLFGTVMTTFSYPLEAGGPASAIWCWLISGIGALCLTFSVAEVASAYPTSGALYFTIKYLAPPSSVPIVAWIDGWLNLVGQICGSASSEYGSAQMLLAAVSIGSDFTYFPTQGHIIGVMAALCILHAAINSMSTAWLNHLAKTYAIFHIAVLVAACVALLALTKDKHSAKYAFTEVIPDSGWTPPGFSFLFGFLSVAWTMTDYDATVHIAEEAKDPARTVPRAIVLALTFTFVVGWLFNIVLVFCMGDPAEILASPIGQPVAQIFYNVLGKGASIFFVVSAFLIMNFVCITALQAGSRTVWAFSRDQMIPGSHIWYRIWSKTDTPVLAVWLYAIICILINLIGLGSYITIAAIFNVCAIALDWSYCIPILCKLLFGRFQPGPFYLGKLGYVLNAWACTWTAFVSVIFLFPTVRPVTADNMNYAVVILAFVFMVATGYWFIHGRFYYTGPRANATVDNGIIVPVENVHENIGDPEKAAAAAGLHRRNVGGDEKN
ncbi:amino acid permease [Grosmannia clavigera kw1407]|uniref:Amino acid permease n=1 Tax=Grosmannia clavigera (strain kw1407 / UAMH 11150) TaxID=655863 RepID=F0XCN2_GROCL|nr:amino acid permease [Grosmannia clavigera kw1407]EFX04269.1 amino acid permease [Grosmannia clavigera kw1407]